MSNKYPSKLLALVKEADKKRFKQDYSEANFVLEIIKQAVEKEIESVDKAMISNESFDKPSWSEYQANLLGQKKSLHTILNLFPNKE